MYGEHLPLRLMKPEALALIARKQGVTDFTLNERSQDRHLLRHINQIDQPPERTQQQWRHLADGHSEYFGGSGKFSALSDYPISTGQVYIEPEGATIGD